MSILVTLSADRYDGNDPLEADLMLPEIPRPGQQIPVWNARAGNLQRNREEELCYSGEPAYLIVDGEAHFEVSERNVDRITVPVRMETYDMRELESAFAALERGDEPGSYMKYEPDAEPLRDQEIEAIIQALNGVTGIATEDVARGKAKLQYELERQQR